MTSKIRTLTSDDKFAGRTWRIRKTSGRWPQVIQKHDGGNNGQHNQNGRHGHGHDVVVKWQVLSGLKVGSLCSMVL